MPARGRRWKHGLLRAITIQRKRGNQVEMVLKGTGNYSILLMFEKLISVFYVFASLREAISRLNLAANSIEKRRLLRKVRSQRHRLGGSY